MAVIAQSPDGVITQLVIDPATASSSTARAGPATAPAPRGEHAAHEYLAIERQGWVNRIGAVPAS